MGFDVFFFKVSKVAKKTPPRFRNKLKKLFLHFKKTNRRNRSSFMEVITYEPNNPYLFLQKKFYSKKMTNNLITVILDGGYSEQDVLINPHSSSYNLTSKTKKFKIFFKCLKLKFTDYRLVT